MKRTLRLAVAVATLVALAAPALAQQGTPPSPEERAKRFDAADANKDGKLDFAEFKKSIPPEMAAQADDARLQTMFGRRDADSDKFITKAEFTAPMQRPQ